MGQRARSRRDNVEEVVVTCRRSARPYCPNSALCTIIELGLTSACREVHWRRRERRLPAIHHCNRHERANSDNESQSEVVLAS